MKFCNTCQTWQLNMMHRCPTCNSELLRNECSSEDSDDGYFALCDAVETTGTSDWAIDRMKHGESVVHRLHPSVPLHMNCHYENCVLIGELDLVFEEDNSLHCFVGDLGLGAYADGWEIYSPEPVGI